MVTPTSRPYKLIRSQLCVVTWLFAPPISKNILRISYTDVQQTEINYVLPEKYRLCKLIPHQWLASRSSLCVCVCVCVYVLFVHVCFVCVFCVLCAYMFCVYVCVWACFALYNH